MIQRLTKAKAVYLCYEPVDFRKNINGLAAIVQGSFGKNPFDGELFVFCNKHKNVIKVLKWDMDGFTLYHKRRERGRFCWPVFKEVEGTINISKNDLNRLLDGLVMEQFSPHKNYTMI
ncbi:IS66 family insertion sequence element accessory protein TnpB [Aminipila luticellarii]|uniref:Transposase n=1 Tax=Aminipila luticellarii TaxID=2507160 RepID=A0A410PV28_9FIRM|nr:IS66 family insertion sequence element accessory protein TnpB [Aminipila luticellarii]QAT42758.1 transposase [Aminipila luticellarii]